MINWTKPIQLRVHKNDGEVVWLDARWLGTIKHPSHTHVVSYMRENGQERVTTTNVSGTMEPHVRNKPEKKNINIVIYLSKGGFPTVVMTSSPTKGHWQLQNPDVRVLKFITEEVEV